MRTKVDTKWFRDRIADRGLSARKIAKMLRMDAPAMSRMLNGKRKMQTDEAADLAGILGEPLDQVLRRAGIQVALESKATVWLTGVVNAQGEISPVGTGKPRSVERPGKGPEDLTGVLLRAPGNPKDGWVAYYVPSTRLEPDAVGRLSVVETSTNKSRQYLTVLTKGFERGKWTLTPFLSESVAPIEDVDVVWAAPVLWIRA
jgi:transcriptional regulator with XRE-family HTH domain